MEFFAQLIIEITMVFPGAFVRWVYFKGKKPFKEILDDNNAHFNVLISFIIIGILILSIVLL